jgi:hypothetical protein
MQIVYLQSVPIKLHTTCNRVLIVGIPPTTVLKFIFWDPLPIVLCVIKDGGAGQKFDTRKYVQGVAEK